MEVLPGGGNERILYVDDEEGLASLGKEFLEDMGYQVTAVSNSMEALQIFSRNSGNFDLVVTDQTMPGLTGLELAVEMAKIAPQVPIVLCSGLKLSLEALDAPPHSIREILLKPEVFEKLPEVIRRILDSPEQPHG
jgi:DNA-binding NtrC family response regulator